MYAEVKPNGMVQFRARIAFHQWNSLAALARHYWEATPLRDGSGNGDVEDEEEDEEIWSSWECVRELMLTPWPNAVDVIQALIDGASDEDEIVAVGAGPLEDLLSHFGHGERFVDEVALRAESSPGLRRAIKSLSLADDVPAVVRDRLLLGRR